MNSMNQPADLNSAALNYLAATTGETTSDTEWQNNPIEYLFLPENPDEFSIEEEINRINTTPLELNYKTTTAGELARERKPTKTDVPKKFQRYASIFDAKKSERFPPSQSYDHKIDLKDTFKLISFKPY